MPRQRGKSDYKIFKKISKIIKIDFQAFIQIFYMKNNVIKNHKHGLILEIS
jgi:hypothetical protein